MTDISALAGAENEWRTFVAGNSAYELTRRAYESAASFESTYDREMRRLVEVDPLQKIRVDMERLYGPLEKIEEMMRQLDQAKELAKLSESAYIFEDYACLAQGAAEVSAANICSAHFSTLHASSASHNHNWLASSASTFGALTDNQAIVGNVAVSASNMNPLATSATTAGAFLSPHSTFGALTDYQALVGNVAGSALNMRSLATSGSAVNAFLPSHGTFSALTDYQAIVGNVAASTLNINPLATSAMAASAFLPSHGAFSVLTDYQALVGTVEAGAMKTNSLALATAAISAFMPSMSGSRSLLDSDRVLNNISAGRLVLGSSFEMASSTFSAALTARDALNTISAHEIFSQMSNVVPVDWNVSTITSRTGSTTRIYAKSHLVWKFQAKFEFFGIEGTDQFVGLERALSRDDAERVRHASATVRALCLQVLNQYAGPKVIECQFGLKPDPARDGRTVTRRQQLAYLASGGHSITVSAADEERIGELLNMLAGLSKWDHLWDGSPMIEDVDQLIFEIFSHFVYLLERMLKAKTTH